MSWTDLITEPRMVTGIYNGAPSLDDFALEEMVLAGDGVKLLGDFGQLPNPLPKRWAERGYLRARGTFYPAMVVESEVSGTPGLHADAGCFKGDPIDLTVEDSGRTWTAPNGTVRPYILLSGRSDYLSFRFVCDFLRVEVRGYRPAPR